MRETGEEGKRGRKGNWEERETQRHRGHREEGKGRGEKGGKRKRGEERRGEVVILWLAEATSRIVGSCRWTCGLGGPHYGKI